MKTCKGACVNEETAVLILDKEPADSMWLKTVLNQAGLNHVDICDEEAGALAHLRSCHVDVIVINARVHRFINQAFIEALRPLLELQNIPILFVSKHNQLDDIAEKFSFIHHDFVVKPFITDEFLARFKRLLHQSKCNKMAVPLDGISLENREACKFYADLINDIAGHQSGISIWTKKLGVFSGDIAVYREAPNQNGSFVLFADAMGHGLCAALSLIPLVHEFESLVNQGNNLATICETLNVSLYNRLPDGVFVAAILVYIDYAEQSATVWNGGMPNAILFKDDDKSLQKIESLNLPLGITTDVEFCYESIEWNMNDSIFLTSDGCVEAMNKDGIPFGYFDGFFEKYHSQHILAIISEQLETHIVDTEPHDDMTLLHLTPSKLKMA